MAAKDAAPFSMVRLLKEIYLSVFVLFFKFSLGEWPNSMNMNPVKGAFANFVMEMWLIFSLLGWYSIYTERLIGLSKAQVVIFSLFLMFLTYYFLVYRKIGTDFEKQFRHFQRPKQLGLLLAAGALFLAVATFFFFSISAYHEAFNMRLPSH